jgi:DNA-binding transcriptional MocR family regulator
MLAVPMNQRGPDLATIEKLVANDASIKGMWCVPKYSNPGGEVYGDDVVDALARMKTAAPDFVLMWDDAYRLHHLTEDKLAVANIVQACATAGNPDRAVVFASTSKVTFAGAGVAALASSAANIAWWQKHVSVRSIGPDKINQLRHVRYLRDRATVEALMDKHRALLKPKFDAVEAQFAARLSTLADVSWTHPKGGYFIDLITPAGRAKRTIELAQALGITLTAAGAAFPYGKDPHDRHIRIAPSFPSLDEINLAAKGVALALRVAIDE